MVDAGDPGTPGDLPLITGHAHRSVIYRIQNNDKVMTSYMHCNI